MATVVISPTGVASYPEGGGHFWVFMQYAHALRRLAPELTLARARRIARCLIESTGAIVDVTLDQSPASARGLVDELVEMQLAYLGSVLD